MTAGSTQITELQSELDKLSDEEYQTRINQWLKTECGKLQFFDVDPWLKVADILTAGDEPMLALKVLDMVPGFYRDNYPIELQNKKSQILALLATPGFYVTNKYDALVREDNAVETIKQTYRGTSILSDVLGYNEQGAIPHIVDLGPGEYWLAIGLHKLGCKFTYQPIGLCSEAHEKAKAIIGEHLASISLNEQPKIFVACEIIEHLHHEMDIRTDCMRVGCDPNIIHISTPKYSFDGRMEKADWAKQGDLGHLRTYTPNEFKNIVVKMWPEYKWTFVDGQPMHMRGFKQDLN